MQAAGVRIGYMRFDGRDLEPAHDSLGCGPSALDAEAYDAAGAVRQVFLSEFIIFVARQAAILHPRDIFVLLQKFRDFLRVFAVTRHAHMQTLKAEIQIIRALRGLNRAEIAHQLDSRLRDIRTREAEALSICHAVITLVGRTQTGVFVRVLRPVKFAGINDRAADGARVAVHVFCRRVYDDICAPFKRAAVDGRCKRVVHNQRNAAPVRGRREFFDIQNGQRRVCNRLAIHGLCVGPKCGVQFLRRAVRIDKRDLDAHALHGDGKKIEAAAINARRTDQMVTRADNIEHREEDRCLPGGRQHGSRTALKRGDTRRDGVVRRVLQAGIKIAARLKIEEFAHFGAALVFERGALDDGDLTGLAVFRAVACLYASRTESELCHMGAPFLFERPVT